MNRIPSKLLAVLAISLLAACNGNDRAASAAEDGGEASAQAAALPEEARRVVLQKELGELMRSFGATVASVKDLATWEPARNHIQHIEARTVEIIGELRTLPQPTPEEIEASRQIMKLNEDDLEKALGDKENFLRSLPQEVASELGASAGSFSSTMGQAQQVLYGAAAR